MITLNFEDVPAEHYEFGEQHTWPLRVVAVSAESGLPSEIFVWHRNAADVLDTELNPFHGARCECVASVHQLSTLQVHEPEALTGEYQAPFYRADVAIFHCLSLHQAAELKLKIISDVQDLLENFRALAAVEAGGSVVVGAV